jgi:hypothetical protein
MCRIVNLVAVLEDISRTLTPATRKEHIYVRGGSQAKSDVNYMLEALDRGEDIGHYAG